jgi:hypothetical protein
MNYTRILLAALAAFVTYMVYGGILFAALPMLKAEFSKFPAVYRDHEGQMSHMPIGMAGMVLSMLALATLYALLYRPGMGMREGLLFGCMIGIFFIGSFVLHNYANLNIGLQLTLYSAIAFFLDWLLVGFVISLVYKPAL